jgi:hypothetical protein
MFGFVIWERLVIKRKGEVIFLITRIEWLIDMPPINHTYHELSIIDF